MKSVFVAACLLVSTSSFAAEKAQLHCVKPGLSDAGLVLTLNVNVADLTIETAELSELSFTDTNKLAALTCEGTLFPAPTETSDEKQYSAICGQEGLNDAGYLIKLASGGITGAIEAEVSEISFLGTKPVDTLTCQFAN